MAIAARATKPRAALRTKRLMGTSSARRRRQRAARVERLRGELVEARGRRVGEEGLLGLEGGEEATVACGGERLQRRLQVGTGSFEVDGAHAGAAAEVETPHRQLEDRVVAVSAEEYLAGADVVDDAPLRGVLRHRAQGREGVV